MAIFTAGFRVEWNTPNTATWVDITTSIKSVSGNLALSGNRANALSFGDTSDISCDIETLDLDLQAAAYDERLVRVYLTINGVETQAFQGLITGRERTLANLTFTCEGLKRIVSRTRVYSPMFERVPAATKTTASSVENPAASGYAAGPINYGLWKAGLRPYEQIASYPLSAAVKGYYSVAEYAILAPEFAWLAGEDTWEECLRLARASGGQITQDRDGVVRYRQPLSFGNGTAIYTFTNDVYSGGLKEGALSEQTATKIICPVIPRTKQLVQTVIDDSNPRRLPGGLNQTLTVQLEPQQPIAKNGWVLVPPTNTFPYYVLPGDSVKAVFGDGTRPTLGTHYWYQVTTAAQQITLVFHNLTALPITFTNLIIKGAPVVAGETITVTGGTGDRTLTVPDNPYVQSEAHAQRLITMMLAFHANNLPIITASGCPYDPNRFVGESVNLTAARWSLSAVKHLIVGIRHSDTGTESEYDMVNVAGLPYTNQFFIVGATNWAGLTRKVGY